MASKHISTLQSLTFLDGASPEVVERLAQQAVERAFEPGEIILAEGSAGREMYLVVEGQVEVVKGHGADELLLGQRGPGDLFGEMALIEDCPRFATIRALEPTRLLVLSEAGMREALAQQPELLYATVRMLSARLRESDLKMIEDLQRKNEELARAYRELEAAQAALVEKERLERELELARGIQQGILPEICPQMPGFTCAARYRAAYQVGGDFYDLIPLDGRRVGLVMADVSGKGMAAALFMALARSLIRAEAQRMASPRETLLRVNRLLLDMSRASLFVTVFYGVLDLACGKLCYVRAGHDYPLLFRSSAGKSQFLGGAGIVLGMLDEIELEEVEVHLDTGDVLILYTDGITEANTPEGELFGPERLREVIQSAGSQSAQGVCDLVFHEVDLFQKGGDQHDDMAVLVARVETSG